MKTFAILLSILGLLGSNMISSGEAIRIASYNIKFFSAGVVNQGDRLDKLKQVIAILDANVIGLQEIADRAGLELLFPPAQWEIVIDDASADDQDVALAVRKDKLKVKSHRFLFPNPQDDTFFPNHRDVLCGEIELLSGAGKFFVMVEHCKSRLGGRSATDSRREGAASRLVDKLKQEFDDLDFVILGDFNDNPDDRSLNILETGNANSPGGPEEIDGPLLVNLMDRLCAQGHVSHGRTPADIETDRIDTIDPDSRQRNNLARGTDANTGDILFDQILFPVWMLDKYVGGSVRVFDHPVAISGSSSTRASDHLPVYAEFDFESITPTPLPNELRIAALLPNPTGADAGREEVTISNGTGNAVNLAGFTLRDKSSNEFKLNGSVPAGSRLTFIMSTNSMPLNNDGDEVTLFDSQSIPKHKVTYSAADVKVGLAIQFP